MTENKNYEITILESPFAGDVELNVAYARACMKDMLLRGEAPYASHLLYTQPGVLSDLDPEERMMGIHAGFAFRPAAKKSVFYTDLGMSRGMNYGLEDCEKVGRPYEMRTLPNFEEWKDEFESGRYTSKQMKQVLGKQMDVGGEFVKWLEGAFIERWGNG